MPKYEEREAARFAGYTWVEWQEIPHEERVMAVAHYRLHHVVDAHRQDAVAAYQERETKKRGH